MSHQQGRVIHDADSHIIEGRGWLESYATEYVKTNLETGAFDLNMKALDPLIAAADKRLAGDDPALTEALKSNIFAHPGKRNMWSAYGAVEKRERSDALSIMGVTSQLIFPSVGAGRFARSKDLEVVYGGCDALNRGMADFCADDTQLKSVGYLSLRDPERAQTSLKLALELGINAIWIGSDAVEGRAPSHIAYDPLWAMMEEAGVPVTLHIGSGQNMPSVYMNTGTERVLAGNIGNIETTKDNKVTVAIGLTGEVSGDITAHRVMVAGKVEGNIYAAERVEFHKESIVQGDISYGSIAVEHGARLLGLVIQNPNSSAASNSNADAKNVIRKAQEGSS